MPTNLAIEDSLIEEAKILGKHKTKKAVVMDALEEYIQRRKQKDILSIFSTIDYDEDYNYKEQRKIK
ncbi:MAG: type II toxin-antitoxin system VapB family antitoxin [Proteobacteria bacterium]|nr:type II toxin-antitoxin system VapB family antitoxin [Pseudomonadota bacterium]MBU1581245.1 type II toxin-antitoxin system VapB family antitoxin [Pseudomonadota bacterium]MBU2456027.1 type II toxin-antitoxin system VapB family antitoxin [Pseudomonadota bacterium]